MTRELLIIGGDAVRALLPMQACMTAMRDALADVSAGRAVLPLRTVMRLPGTSARMFASMPGAVDGALGAKVISVYPGNHGGAFDSHQGAVLLFDPDTGALEAVMDATSVTAIRTAAVSGVATELLARDDACELAILGSGVQAATHLEAMLAARPVRRVRIWSRSEANARRFADQARAACDAVVEVHGDARAAVEGADIICTTTASREPVLAGDWVAHGAHINAVGASTPSARELDSAAVARARLYVDRRESTLAEAGDFLVAREEGAVTDAHIVAELGELILGRAPGRAANQEITLFKSLGLAVEDLAAARVIVERARATGTGQRVSFA